MTLFGNGAAWFWPRFVAVIVAGVGVLSVFPSAQASAAYLHPYQSQLTGLAYAYSVAVDAVSGHTLVADSGPDVVKEYDSSGNLLTTWTGGTCQAGSAAGTSGSTACSTPAGSLGGGQITVATNDSTGDVYVTDSSDAVVDVFASTGAYLGQLTGATFVSPRGIAVDQATGKIYVADPGAGVVDVFSSSGAFTGTLTGQTLTNAFSVAVDDVSGQVLVADSGTDVVYAFDAATGAYVSTWDGSAAANPPGAPAGSFGSALVEVAADNVSGHVYVGDGSDGVVDEFGASGNYLNQLTGTPSGPFSQSPDSPLGVGVDQTTGDVYVADTFGGVVDVFGDVLVPDVTSGQPSSVTPTSATLNGVVNPDGTTLTDCHFDWGTDTTYGQTAACVPAAGSIPADSNNHAVTADISGLTAGVTYHFRLVASNSSGTNDGTDVAFGPPVVSGQFADQIGPTGVRVHAKVNPQNVDTTYRFEYGTSGPCSSNPCTSVPIPNADIGSAATDVAVAQSLTGLTPGTTYDFRVVASNSAGATDGPDQTFTTNPSVLVDLQPPTGMSTATGLSNGTATLNSYLDPQSSDTTYHFEYGTTTAYGSSTPSADAGAGNGPGLQSAQISGLSGGTTYHYRVVASNSYGTTTSPDYSFTTPPSSCPNQQFRTGPSAALPDCRAYEQVSPQDKAGYPAEWWEGNFNGLGTGGDRFVFQSQGSFAGDQSGQPFPMYLAQRGVSGWSTSALYPPLSSGLNPVPLGPTASPDLGSIVLAAGFPFTPGQGPALNNVAQNGGFFARQADGSYTQVSPTLSRVDGLPFTQYTNTTGNYGEAGNLVPSADLSHQVFVANGALNASDPLGEFDDRLYDLSESGGTYSSLRLANIGPAGIPITADCGPQSFLQPGGSTVPMATKFVHDISDGGSTIFFSLENSSVPGGCQDVNVLARVDGSRTVDLAHPAVNAECTTSACTGAPAGWALFAGASANGSRAFFVSQQQLTDQASEDASGQDNNPLVDCASTQGPNGCNLYMYDFNAPAGHNLVDVSAGDVSGSGPQVKYVLQVSDDGSRVYFVAGGLLSTEPNSLGQVAQAGAENLYVYDADRGVTSFIGELCSGAGQSGSVSDQACGGDDSSLLGQFQAYAPGDGRYLAFTTHAQLTPDDTNQAADVYQYDAVTGSVTRVSLGHDGQDQNGNAGGQDAQLTGTDQPEQTGAALDVNRPMSDDGQTIIFFTARPLQNSATNGVSDVYEWHQGEVSLISSGQSPTPIPGLNFSGAAIDPSGQDIAFTSDQGLVPSDTDGLTDIYDARIDGGFASLPAPVSCSGDSCQGTPGTPPSAPTVGTVVFTGPGNATPGGRPARPRVITRAVRSARFMVRVRVPGAGEITVRGGSRTVRRHVSRAGSYAVQLTLSARARRSLAHRHRLVVRLRVSYAARGASAQTATVRITVLPARHQATRHAIRQARSVGFDRGGAR